MAHGPLHPDVALEIEIGCVFSRDRYTNDPQPVIDEARRVAGDRTDLLARAAGGFVGGYEDQYTRALCDAVREQIPGIEEHAAAVRARRGSGGYTTEGFRSPWADQYGQKP